MRQREFVSANMLFAFLSRRDETSHSAIFGDSLFSWIAIAIIALVCGYIYFRKTKEVAKAEAEETMQLIRVKVWKDEGVNKVRVTYEVQVIYKDGHFWSPFKTAQGFDIKRQEKEILESSLRGCLKKKEFNLQLEQHLHSGKIKIIKREKFKKEAQTSASAEGQKADNGKEETMKKLVCLILALAFVATGNTVAIAGASHPDKTAKRVVWRWKHVGAQPCLNCEQLPVFREVLQKMEVPKDVRDAWFIQVGNKESRSYWVKSGDRFNQMVFGTKRDVKNNVLADWGPKEYEADLYSGVEYGGKRYFLVMPHYCKNWSWWSEDVPLPPVVEEKQLVPDVEEVPAPEPEREIIAGPIVETLPEPEPIPMPVPEEKKEPRCSFDAALFGGISERIQGHGRGNYYGADLTVYCWKIGEHTKIGPSAQFVAWKGYDFHDIQQARGHWKSGKKGGKKVAGVGLKHMMETNETTFRLRYGQKESRFHLPDYRNHEWNYLVNIEAYHTFWYNTQWYKRKWFQEFEFGVRLDLDAGGKKKSWSQDGRISSHLDPIRNQSEYSVSAKTEVYRANKHLAFTLGFGATYSESMRKSVFSPQAGVKLFKDTLVLWVERQYREGGGNDAVAANAMVDTGKTFQAIKK